jgi:hypothetical protein
MIASIFFMGFRLCVYGDPATTAGSPSFWRLVKHEPCQPAMPRLDKALEPEKQAKLAFFAQKMSSHA